MELRRQIADYMRENNVRLKSGARHFLHGYGDNFDDVIDCLHFEAIESPQTEMPHEK